eukprot:12855962-Ditylum_brightwellii.AAC.1
MPPNLPKTVCPSPTTEGNGTEDEALRLLTEYADDGDEAPRGDRTERYRAPGQQRRQWEYD